MRMDRSQRVLLKLQCLAVALKDLQGALDCSILMSWTQGCHYLSTSRLLHYIVSKVGPSARR